MAYYTALINAWNSTTQPPPGVNGGAHGVAATPLSPGNTLQHNVDIVNSWTVDIPAIPCIVPTYKIYNAIVPTDYTALSPTNQALVNTILAMGTVDASNGTNVRNVLQSVFASTATLTSLAAMVAPYDYPQQPAWQSIGLSSPINTVDIASAGLGAPG